MADLVGISDGAEQAPDELELLETVEYRTPDGPCDLFVFRVSDRPAALAADRGWMIDVAGPYRGQASRRHRASATPHRG